jgi:benzoate/toluate 1,2-dioxygenase reductase subunit
MTDQPYALAAATAAARVTLRFTDGVEQQLDVAPGQLVLDAAIEAGLALSYQCRSGSCTSCIARLSTGEADMRPGSSSLMPSEKAAGQRLLCLTEAQSDCAFDLPYESTSVGATTKVHAFINAVEHLASDVVRLELELADGDWMDFKPGQFIQLEIPGTGQSRSYSIASTPAELPKIELLIRLLADGLTSNWLRSEAKPDDAVALEGPYGSFFLRPAPSHAPQLMIAGGTGLAPMLSMIDTLRAKPGKKPRIILSFGCASLEQLFHQEALELRSQWMPGLETRICIDWPPSEGAAPAGLRLGNPVAAMLETPLDPASTAYLCGPPAMVAAARDALIAAGLQPENIHAEQFVASH